VENAYGCVDSASIEITFSYAACTGTGEIPYQKKAVLFPNPGSGLFNLKMAEAQGPFTVSVTDLSGRILFSKDYQPVTSLFTTTLDLSEISPGIYFVKISGKNEDRSLKVILVN
jgi:hypothetical protein